MVEFQKGEIKLQLQHREREREISDLVTKIYNIYIDNVKYLYT